MSSAAPTAALDPHRLQLLPQPALPEVPGPGPGRMARRAAGRAAAGALFPRRLHPAGAGRPRSPSRTRPAVYAILFRAAAETLRTIAADPQHLGAEIGVVAVLHTWGQTLQHHPHVHCVVPGGGLVARRHALDRLPARLLPAGARALAAVPTAVPASNCGPPSRRASCASSATSPTSPSPPPSPAGSATLRRIEWVVYAKPPFGGPEQVLAYLGRYTHRVAIANSRLVSTDRRQGQLPLEGLPPGRQAARS